MVPQSATFNHISFPKSNKFAVFWPVCDNIEGFSWVKFHTFAVFFGKYVFFRPNPGRVSFLQRGIDGDQK